ncbi:putative secreted protein [Wickerhamomyces ciferrii]|uniref:Secreted protein n=1 Tax=Wickerhamomyces ciferrii (strain ATCC 14091 / BCRC 22168 / CBS 111 / JCM 3599 / NBRC 0793 / NRRL Y-1031 F-60-10) TaxID=1206466 RepID=K0KSN0_WICCF|nr:uncharacterized protein BN7_5754 [Wickerhamomyces ciferrii]CCH46166.1 putative secreted protein [Wickerhamomyces ciferrii]
MTLKRMFFKKTRLVIVLLLIISANLGLLSILKYDKQRIIALTSLKSYIQTPTDLKNKNLDLSFVRDNKLSTNISTNYFIPDYLYNGQSKTYTFDPRLSIGIYLNHINEKFQSNNDLSKIKLPFSWYDWTDLGSSLNKLINLPQNFKPDCSYVCTNYFNKELQKELEEKIKGTFVEQFEDDQQQQPENGPKKKPRRIKKRPTKHQLQKYSYCNDDNSEFQPGFRIFKNHLKSRPDVKALQSKSFLYSEAQSPISLTFLTPNGNLQFETLSNEGKTDKQEFGLLRNKMIQNYKKSFVQNQQSTDQDSKDIFIDPKNELNSMLSTIGPKLPNHSPKLPLDQFTLELNQSQFIFDAPNYLRTNDKPQSKHQEIFTNSLKSSLQTKELFIEKYFREVLLSRTTNHLQGGHFDWRFFSGDINQHDRSIILSRLLQNWFKLTSNSGLISWLAHGQLLSYDFNGLNFPWDDDLDVQMPFQDFAKFSELYNGTLVIEDPNIGLGRYFIDVTNSLTHRLKGNNNNHIDARFIDVDTGLFIDITALAVSPSDLPRKYENDYKNLMQKGEELKHVDPNAFDGIYDDLDKETMRELIKVNPELYKQLRQFQRESQRSTGRLITGKTSEEKYDINYKLQIFNCRNDHFISMKDLSPLKRSFHEKIPVFIPNNISSILLDEYKQQKTLTNEYQGYHYLPQLRLWIQSGKISNIVRDEDKRRDNNLITEQDVIKLLEQDDEILFEYAKTWDITLIREKEKEILRDQSLSSVDKDYYLERLIMTRSFPSMRKDFFISKLEDENFINQKIRFDKELLQTIMIEQLHKEYQNKVDYNSLGYEKTSETDTKVIEFNKIGESYKTILKKVQIENFEPDVEIKKQELESKLKKSNSDSEKFKINEELTRLLKNEIIEKFDEDSPKPKILNKGEVPGVIERPKPKPMDDEDDTGVVQGVEHQDGKVQEVDKGKDNNEGLKDLPKIEMDPEKEFERLDKFENQRNKIIM